MTTIRISQIKQFEDVLRANLDASVAETFRDVWPDRVQSLGDRYLEFIHSAIDRAYTHDLTSDADAARFVNLTLLWGLGFEDSPAHQWARELLADHDVPAGIRVQQLYERSEIEIGAYGPPEPVEAQ